MTKSTYESPLCSRYASKQMQQLFSPDTRYQTWRRLWVVLAQAEKELGIAINDEQIAQLEEHVNNINYDVVAAREKETRHDVMAHVYGYGVQCPKAAGIIHLGATSCYVTDNADLMIYRDALQLVLQKILHAIANLAEFAGKYKDMPTLGYTHFQPAQLVTVGKRACLWISDLMLDVEELEFVIKTLKLLGSKGTTGTQASFLELFEGDHDKVKRLDQRIAQICGFDGVYAVSGQTYPRKVDSRILNALSAVAQSGYRFANDMRLLQHMREVEEPFESGQIGSSAMAYKRNPMRSERICSLARYVMVNALNAPMTASVQWMERTLDDSANRRISLPEAFLAVDAVLNLIINVTSGMVVYPKIIERNIQEFLPFIATENLLMEAVKKGGDRQELHEIIRGHSMEASRRMKEEGLPCDLLQRLSADPHFDLDAAEIQAATQPMHFIGRCPEQVQEYLDGIVLPLLQERGVVKSEVKIEV